ncbi:MAG: DegT/DnrJ/EryC1/StrS family aminotransferase [Burkholderiales bacterium]|nr:DegT/DnrJ/EryC1/StrS family aminotransferase [Burkholderiales bacterium]
MNFKIPFSGRAHAYTAEELETIVETAKSAAPLTQGRHRNEFEAAFKAYAGVEHCFAVCNAASALELTAQLCCFKPGDEVIIPSHTYTASAYPYLKKGAKIVWADIDPATRVVTADTLRACITPRTRAIVVVHLYGYGADMPAIMALAKENQLLVVEDVAQALGVEIEGQKAGSFGDFGVFSFHSHKNVSTLGEGGMLTVRDPARAAIVPMLRHNGHADYPEPRKDYWRPAMGNVDLPMLGEEILMPNNYCLGEVECALGVKLLQRIDASNAEKRARAIRCIDALAAHPELQFHRVTTTRHNYHLLVARIANSWRDGFIRRMAQEHGVQCVVQYYPLNRYPFYQKLGYGVANSPNVDDFFDNMVSFPFQHSLTEGELDYMVGAARTVLKKLAV